MTKINKLWKYLLVALFCFSLTSGNVVFAASAAKQLARGIAFYEDNKNDEAMDCFIDVLVSGNKEQVAEANKYVELIHNRIGGIQTPVEVDINFKEGEVKSLEDVTDASVRAAQAQAQAEAAELAAQAQAIQDEAAAKAAAARGDAVAKVQAEQQALTERIEANRLAAQESAEQARQNAIQRAADVNEAAMEAVTVSQTAGAAGLSGTAQADLRAIDNQEQAVLGAAHQDDMMSTTSAPSSSTFTDLTSPEAIEAREIYTSQKLESMKAAAIEKISAVKGVHLYFRDGLPDALDMDADVIFQGNKFRPEGLTVLDDIYDLLALTQNAGYIILPPGSYTDDVTLSGIRQAMALNSYFVNRGISQGKLHYNMGLVDQEPPARFANLNGLSIVFDYTAQLPTQMEKNEGNEKAPLLSMAIVPQCHAIDRSLGEAYAIDFSVLETVNPVDNWMLQVVQHGRDGQYYVVRQLEGFTPVYHQILWNGRKGIIGPELPCGKYTLVLTATDLKGQKQTLRRRIIVKCTEQKAASASSSCNTSACQKAAADELCPNCNYKASRLWVKPGRTMKAVSEESAPAAQTAADPYAMPAAADPYAMPTNTADPYAMPDTVNNAAYSVDPAAAAYAPAQQAYTAPQGNTATSAAPAEMPVNNPYDMPYEQYGN